MNETEIKLSAPAEILPELRRELGALAHGEWEKFEMRSDYYDTPERELRATGRTLRFRTENGRGRATLKTDLHRDGSGLSERREDECFCADAREGFAKLGCGMLRLEPIAHTEYVRSELTISSGGAEIIAALDEMADGTAEVELELKTGSSAELLRLAEDLRLKYPLLPKTRSKLASALDRAAGLI